ncbi:MAG TPA: hypothetical protein VE569_13240, partial [Acidimicrobiia bacterium]|nr:hypothetical protein [Acidimicrobiia bacterium]
SRVFATWSEILLLGRSLRVAGTFNTTHPGRPGHWEGDLLMGRRKTAIGTLVERWSRNVMLFRLPDGNTADSVRAGLAEVIQRLPDHLWQSLTWDQGKERAEHAQFTIDTRIQIDRTLLGVGERALCACVEMKSGHSHRHPSAHHRKYVGVSTASDAACFVLVLDAPLRVRRRPASSLSTPLPRRNTRTYF